MIATPRSLQAHGRLRGRMDTPCNRYFAECEVCSEVFGSVFGEAFGTLLGARCFLSRVESLGMGSVGGSSFFGVRVRLPRKCSIQLGFRSDGAWWEFRT
ncbi:hypothetical protein K523DRAFT_149048 [Schizophyllum commune Tattone D]|nr:hypothetical protein K523DRAFT_149048 [Schizophyllum commune Tattone D]